MSCLLALCSFLLPFTDLLHFYEAGSVPTEANSLWWLVAFQISESITRTEQDELPLSEEVFKRAEAAYEAIAHLKDHQRQVSPYLSSP